MMNSKDPLKKAVLWKSLREKKVSCNLCRWQCVIADGHLGRCRVRKNINGVLYSLVYDKICAAGNDPIEKKPLFHFQPGSQSFSISTPGCNFQCVFCQNWQISQSPTEDIIDGQAYTPEQIVAAAQDCGCQSIAYTYTEPTIFMELCADTATLARKNGLANVFVSNGYMTREAIDFARPWLDGINIDLKSFREDFYNTLCKAHLKPVLDTIRYIAKETNIWMEITTLVVPGQNDSEQELRDIANFIAKEVSPDVPWHVSRFYPQYQMTDNKSTPPETLELAYELGKEAGLRYVYVGNLPGSRAESTFCYRCGALLIERIGYTIRQNRIQDYTCPDCGAEIAGFGL